MGFEACAFWPQKVGGKGGGDIGSGGMVAYVLFDLMIGRHIVLTLKC